MVAGVEVAVMFDRKCLPAFRRKDAETLWYLRPRFECNVKDLHKDAAHVATHPLIKDRREKPAVLQRLDRPLRDIGLLLREGLEQNEAVRIRLLGLLLYDGDELQVLAADLLEKAINLLCIVGILAIDNSQGIELNAVLFQNPKSAHYVRMGWLPSLVDSISIMQLFRTVYGKTDEKFIRRQELAPLVIKQRAVGLEAIVDPLAICVFVLQFDDVLEKWYAEQCGLAALPCKTYFLARLRLDVLADVGVEHGFAHAKLPPLFRVEILLLEVVTVGAVEVADGPMRLGHDMYWLHSQCPVPVAGYAKCAKDKAHEFSLVGGSPEPFQVGVIATGPHAHEVARLL